jgi:hypothetical protein
MQPNLCWIKPRLHHEIYYTHPRTFIITFFRYCTGKKAPPGEIKKASVNERVDITDITTRYDRPGVMGREGKIWGGWVHYISAHIRIFW